MSDRDEPRDFNSTEIKTSGNLAARPRDISRNKDRSVVVFGIFANRRSQGEEFSKKFDCKSINSNMSENLYNSLRKGMAVEVEGRLEETYWTNRDGEEVLQSTILLSNVTLPLKYRSLEDHISKFEDSDEEDEDDNTRSKGRGRRSRDEDDDDDDDDEDEDETPRSRRSSRRSSSGGSRRSARSSRRSDDDDEDETPRRSRRSTRTKGDDADEDDEI